MRNYNFYIAYAHEGKPHKVKKEGCQEEYDGFRLNGYKLPNRKWVITEEYSGLSFIKHPIKNKKEAFDEALANLTLLAKKEEISIPEFLARYTNVNSYPELKGV